VLVLHIPDALQDTAANGIAQVFWSGLWVDITQIHGPVHGLNPAHTIGHVASVHHVDGCEWCTPIRRERKVGLLRRHCLLGNERLSSGRLGLLSCSLLRLGNVGTAVFPIVDSLACPRRFSGKSVNYLKKNRGNGQDSTLEGAEIDGPS